MRLLTNHERLILRSCDCKDGGLVNAFVFREEIRELCSKGMINTYEATGPMIRYFITPLGKIYVDNLHLPLM